MKHKEPPFSGLALSGFCMQISILLKSAVPLFEGLQIMAEDSQHPQQKEILKEMSQKLRLGIPFHQALKESESFPPYTEQMVMLGERTGQLDSSMERLAQYYEKEYRLAEEIRKAVTYPALMVFMLLIILFTLFTKVMPVFSGVYEQLGAEIPPIAAAAIRLGGILSGAALCAAFFLAILLLLFYVMGKRGSTSRLAASLSERIKAHSSIAEHAAKRRFCSTLASALQCGMKLEEGFQMAQMLANNQNIEAKLALCKKEIAAGNGIYDSISKADLFQGFELQMIRIGSRAGQLERVMDQLAEEYDQKTSETIDNLISRLEPTLVSILAAAVGLVLLSVMLPLAGVLSAIG